MEMAQENRMADVSEMSQHQKGHETVLVAMDARSALWIVQHNDRIQLLFTDVMMPDHMNGIDLAREARRCRPDLKVLLTSGYAGFDRNADEFPMLPKPYRRAELAKRVRATLDAA
jgi:DNA-binding LytR/AlgR family response regulator